MDMERQFGLAVWIAVFFAIGVAVVDGWLKPDPTPDWYAPLLWFLTGAVVSMVVMQGVRLSRFRREQKVPKARAPQR